MGDLLALGKNVIGMPGTEKVNYSIEEHIIGTWYDGSTLYEKTVDCGTLPNATTKSVPHGISNIDRVYHINGVAAASTAFKPLPFMNTATLSASIQIYVTLTSIEIRTGDDQSGYNGYITFRYTKTS